MRSALIAVFVVALAALAPGVAGAETLPTFDGSMGFPDIQGPEGSEEFSWEVKFGEEEELKQIDEQHAGLFWEDGTLAMQIEATAAHDADGTAVPTTLAITQPNIVTLIVHHRAGNPAAGGAPFVYPITQGVGWEGGFETVRALIPPEELPPPPPTCVVPDLTGRSLKASRKLLHQSHCRLGAVRGEQVRTAHVVKQYRLYGRSLPLWTKVDVKALRGPQYSRSS